jgi:hypothetical protein
MSSRLSVSSRHKALAGLALTTLLGLGCEPPPVVPTADRRQNAQTSRLEGTVLVQGRARGNAVVFLYDADRPPPPQGSGRPVTFTVIPREQLFGAAALEESGPFIAPFSFSLVPAGRYTVRGFIDADTCHTGAQPCHAADFIPWYDVTAQPNAGDVGGAAVDANRQPRVLEVAAREDGTLNAVTGVTVSFSDAVSTVPLDRPAFRVEGTARLEPSGGTKLLTLKPEPIQDGVMDVRPPGFLVRYVDDNNDGVPDLDSAGKRAVWPRVLVRKLAPAPSLADENDLDRNGVLDAQGEDYVHLDNSQDGQPDLVVLRAGLVTDPLYAALNNQDGTPRMTAAIVPELTLAVIPQAVDARDPRAPAALKTLPSGRYSVTLVQPTGQTWRVPNELTPALATPLGLPRVESQAFFLEVP